jgi:hypothetical protein
MDITGIVIITREAPDIRFAGYRILQIARYPAGYRILQIAGYPARFPVNLLTVTMIIY